MICALFSPTVCASLLEMMLESSLSDLRDAQGVALPFCPSLVRLLRLLQDVLFAEGTDNRTLWSEKVTDFRVQWYSVCGHILIPHIPQILQCPEVYRVKYFLC